MVKKRRTSKRRIKRYAGKTEKEWQEWGEEFGEQMGKIGENFDKHMETQSKEYKGWWWTFGLIGPFIGSIFGIIFLIFGVWLLNFINIFRIGFVSLLSVTVLSNIHLFFAAFLFFGYGGYLSKRFDKTYWTFSPIIISGSVIFSLWICTLVIDLINYYVNSNPLAIVSDFIYANLYGFFFLFLFLFYAASIIDKLSEGVKWKR